MIWLVGNRGMLGQEVESAFQRRGFPFVSTDLELDITDGSAVDSFVAEHRAEWIVNCAAYTAVDRAEDEEDLARAVNAVGPRNLARATERHGVRLIHISTDYVFDGKKDGYYEPSDTVSPLSAYGRTKAEGEVAIAGAAHDYYIIRTAWLYGKHGKNFVSTMLRLMRERESVRVVGDQHGCPTYAPDLAAAIARIVEAQDRQSDNLFGIYHYTDKGETTWYGFAEEIARQALQRGLLERPAEVEPILTADYPTKAVRPANSRLSLDKIVRSFGVEVHPWQESLSRCLEELEE